MGGSGGSPPERKIEDGRLIESPFPPLFPPFPPVGRRVGIPHFWAWVPWMGYGVECVREWLEGARGSPAGRPGREVRRGFKELGIEREISFLSSSSSPLPSLLPLPPPSPTHHHTPYQSPFGPTRDFHSTHHPSLLLQSCLFSTIPSPMLCFSQSIHSRCLLNG